MAYSPAGSSSGRLRDVLLGRKGRSPEEERPCRGAFMYDTVERRPGEEVKVMQHLLTWITVILLLGGAVLLVAGAGGPGLWIA